MFFEFLIPRRPVSSQAKDNKHLQAWKNFVCAEAGRIWSGTPHNGSHLHLTLVYVCDDSPADVDNIIKPIQDALVGLVYDDDFLIDDVEAHRRPLTDTFDIAACPSPLVNGILSGTECVYVRVNESTSLESYL